MPTDLAVLSAAIIELLTTYVVHSTLLLGGAWLGLRVFRVKSPALREQLWKGAAVSGILTAPAALAMSTQESWVLELPSRSERPLLEIADAAAHTEQPASELPVDTGRDAELPAALSPVIEMTLIDEAGNPSTFTPRLEESTSDAVLESAREPSQEELTSQPDGFLHLTTESEVQVVEPTEEAAVAMATLDTSVHEMTPSIPDEPVTTAPAKFATIHRDRAMYAALAFLATIAVLNVAVLIARSVRFSILVRRCAPIENGTERRCLDELLRQITVSRPVTLLAVDDSRQPAAFGLFHWRILIPANLGRRLPRDEFSALLAHELAHLVRGDAWWLAFGRVLCAAGYFQPLNFLARREWQRAAEWQCDNWAVEYSSDPLALARCLTTVAEWRLSPSQGTTLGAVGSRSHLSDRVERLLEAATFRDPWSRGARRWILIAAILAVAFGVAGIGPRTSFSASDMPESSERESTAASLVFPSESDSAFEDTGSLHSPPAGEIPPNDASQASGGRESPASGDAPQTRTTDAPSEVFSERAALAEELQRLEQEIALLTESLTKSAVTSEMQTIAVRLRERMRILNQRQKSLNSIHNLSDQKSANH